MRVLAFDPGYGRTGWGAIEKKANQYSCLGFGVIETPANQELSQRLSAIYNQALELVQSYRPTVLAMERLFFGQSTTTAAGVFQAQGALLAALGQTELAIIQLSPPEIKSAVTGSGKARKTEVELMVRRLLGISETIQPDDAADALACAICASQKNTWQQVLRGASR